MADLVTKLNELAANRGIKLAPGFAVAAALLLDANNRIAFDPSCRDGGLRSRSVNDVCELEGIVNPTAANTAASLTAALTGANNDLVFTAVPAGTLGNAISVQYIDPGAPSIALSVAVNGSAIQVTLATDSGGVITTIASDIAALAGLGSLVTIANAAANNGTGLATAMAATNLSGGVGATGVGVAGKGSRFTNYVLGTLWVNTGTKAAPTWVQLATV